MRLEIACQNICIEIVFCYNLVTIIGILHLDFGDAYLDG